MVLYTAQPVAKAPLLLSGMRKALARRGAPLFFGLSARGRPFLALFFCSANESDLSAPSDASSTSADRERRVQTRFDRSAYVPYKLYLGGRDPVKPASSPVFQSILSILQQNAEEQSKGAEQRVDKKLFIRWHQQLT